MELDTVEAELLVRLELFIERDGLADFRAERVGALVNIPWTERKTEGSLQCEISSLLKNYFLLKI